MEQLDVFSCFSDMFWGYRGEVEALEGTQEGGQRL